MCDRCRPSCYSTRAVYSTVLTLVAFAAMPATAAAQAPDPSTATATDVSATRLYFAPTGRSLPAGKGYVSLIEGVVPAVHAGVTDRFSLGAGVPLFGYGGLMLTPKLQVIRTAATNASVGVMQWVGIGESSGGLAFAVVTTGSRDAGVTVGGFVPYGPGGPSRAWLLVGGEKRMGARTRFITENHIWPGEFGLLTAGIRFGGGRWSADLGVGIKVPAPAVPWPVLNVTYRFQTS